MGASERSLIYNCVESELKSTQQWTMSVPKIEDEQLFSSHAVWLFHYLGFLLEPAGQWETFIRVLKKCLSLKIAQTTLNPTPNMEQGSSGIGLNCCTQLQYAKEPYPYPGVSLVFCISSYTSTTDRTMKDNHKMVNILQKLKHITL